VKKQNNRNQKVCSCILWIGVDELAHFSDNAKVQKIASEWDV